MNILSWMVFLRKQQVNRWIEQKHDKVFDLSFQFSLTTLNVAFPTLQVYSRADNDIWMAIQH